MKYASAPADAIARASAIDGWMSETELLWLASRAREAKVIVEVGSYKGRSTRALADNCPGVVYAVDPWDGIYVFDSGRECPIETRQWEVFARNMVDHLDLGKVVALKHQFKDALAVLPTGVDLVFLDGDHRYESVVQDIAWGSGLLRPGGILSGHDYAHAEWPGVKRAVDLAFSDTQVVDSIWWRVQ
jgi:predicted O-methyltransferase YrrM